MPVRENPSRRRTPRRSAHCGAKPRCRRPPPARGERRRVVELPPGEMRGDHTPQRLVMAMIDDPRGAARQNHLFQALLVQIEEILLVGVPDRGEDDHVGTDDALQPLHLPPASKCPPRRSPAARRPRASAPTAARPTANCNSSANGSTSSPRAVPRRSIP